MFELEVLVDRATGEFWALDLNPRGFGQISLDIALGNDLPRLWYESVTGTSLPATPPTAPRPEFWHERTSSYVGFAIRLARGPNRAAILEHALGRMRAPSVDAMFERRDPIPGLVYDIQHFGHPRAFIRPYLVDIEVSDAPISVVAASSVVPEHTSVEPSPTVIGAARQRLKDMVKTRVGPFVAGRQPTRTDLPPAMRGLSIGPNGTLWSGAADLQDLARNEGTPLHVVRADRLDENASAAQETVDGRHGSDVFYSYKTNPVPAVLQRLHGRGVGAEVISPYELWLALRLGVPGERIIYNGPAKSADSIRTAIERDVLLINANSSAEAGLIARVAAEHLHTVKLGIRINLPGMWGGQFGIGSTSPQVVDTVRRALAEPYVDLRALHFHRGLTIRDGETMHGYLASILEFCDGLRAQTGWHPTMLDIGGSLACPTVASIPTRQFRLNRALGVDLLPPDPDETLGVGRAACMAVEAVVEHFAPSGLPVPRVILEPGRAMTGDTQLLLTTVLDVKDDGELVHAVLDAGINVAEPVPNEYHQLFSVTSPARPATTPYRLVGPICTPADVLYNHWRLPRLEPGHVLAIMDSGAYFVPFSTTFSFPKPAIVMQDGAEIVSCCRRETAEDVVALDAFSEPGGPLSDRRSPT